MRLALVTCFNADWHFGRVPSPYVPLNLLGLAAVARRSGHDPVVVDPTLALLEGRVSDGPGFHRQVAELICASRPDAIGLTTMCNSYPQTLTLARRCRELDPGVRILLGGPQASVVDVATLREFDWIDAIVRNEADRSLPQVLDRWAAGDGLAGVAGTTWRGPDGGPVREPAAPLLHDLDELPFPAYDLYPFERARVDLAPVEAGRGCPYGCTFCSTNVFFNRDYRIKSPARLIAEMRHLRETYGFTRFDLVHDMLTVDRRWVMSFCTALIDGGYGFEWACSARTDRVDDDLLAAMAAAGCRGMFFGIETGSQRMQPLVRKRLRIDEVLPIIQAGTERGISCTGSMIVGFPEENTDDAVASLELALDILELSPDTQAQMHLLAPLVGSPLYESHRDELRFDGHSSDISLFLLDEEEIATVTRHPDIFPSFYHIPTPHLDRDLAKAISAVTYTCPTLIIALRKAGVDLRQLLTGWTRWQRRHVGPEQLRPDYYLSAFVPDLCRYLTAEVLGSLGPVTPILRDLMAYTEVRYALQRRLTEDRTVFRAFDCDVRALSASLRSGGGLDVERVASDLLFVNLTTPRGRGYAFLEVAVPRTADAPVRLGDRLEIRDPNRQLLSRPELIIRNISQRRAFAAKHHLTERHLTALGLRREPAGATTG
ncbi:B12-binding domain-containing radical SAM protein [Streptomyces sp. NPDC127166]|uniref:B12-binding domain-containing radical SAM protein n=1 Tax=Streptomyces sp. NPDC127166 TaxID=3345380 RepID=UPI003633A2A4